MRETMNSIGEITAQQVAVGLYKLLPDAVETMYEGDIDGLGTKVEMDSSGFLLLIDRCAVYPVPFKVSADFNPARVDRVARFFRDEIGIDSRTRVFAARCRPLMMEGGEQFYIECTWGVL